MRFKIMVLATAAFAVLLAPLAQADDSTTARLQALKERLASLEQKLETRETTVDAQKELLEQGRNGTLPEVSQGSPLDGFLSGLEIGGHIAGSYTYAFENPNTTQGPLAAPVISQPLCQFNCNHNTFNFDAAKINIGKQTQGRGTAGFQLDLLFGANNQILGGQGNANDTGVFVQQAYMSYDWNDVVFKFGKFETLLGYEVLDSPSNPNISHGVLFTWAIPLFHTGLLATGNLTEEIGWAAGITNGFNNVVDTNENKGLLAQLRYDSGPLFASVQTYYGADRLKAGTPALATDLNSSVDNQTDDQLIIDFVATYDPSEELHFWFNADWGEQEDAITSAARNFNDAEWWGISLGSKVGLGENAYAAVRAEYMDDQNGYRIIGNPPGINAFTGGYEDVEVYTLTGTLGYNLTDNLMTRAEVRYDRLKGHQDVGKIIPSGTCVGGAGCPGAGSSFEESGVTGYLEVAYTFD